MDKDKLISIAKSQDKFEECDKIIKLWDGNLDSCNMIERMCHVITIHA